MMNTTKPQLTLSNQVSRVPMQPKYISDESPFEKLSLSSVFAGLKVPTPGMFLFLLGLNGMYFLPLIFRITYFESAISGSYRYYILSWLLITLGALIETLKTRIWVVRKKFFWFAIFIVGVFLMDVRSFLDGEPPLLVFQKSAPFFWLLLIPAIGMRARNWPWIWLTLLLQAPVSIIFSLNAFFFQGATSRASVLDFDGQNFLAICLYMSLLLTMMLPIINGRRLKILIIILFILEILYSVFFYSRFIVFLVPVQIILLVYIYLKSKGLTKGMKMIVTILVSLVLIVSFGLVYGFAFNLDFSAGVVNTVDDAVLGLNSRLNEKGTLVNTILENERWIEIRAVTNQMDGIDWVFGRGLTASWSDRNFGRGEVRYMVHNTWLNSFYWGGVFLFLFITIPIVWILKILILSKNKAGLCAGAFLLTAYFGFPTHLRTLPSLDWVLFCLAVGVCLWHGTFKGETNRMQPIKKLE